MRVRDRVEAGDWFGPQAALSVDLYRLALRLRGLLALETLMEQPALYARVPRPWNIGGYKVDKIQDKTEL